MFPFTKQFLGLQPGTIQRGNHVGCANMQLEGTFRRAVLNRFDSDRHCARWNQQVPGGRYALLKIRLDEFTTVCRNHREPTRETVNFYQFEFGCFVRTELDREGCRFPVGQFFCAGGGWKKRGPVDLRATGRRNEHSEWNQAPAATHYQTIIGSQTSV